MESANLRTLDLERIRIEAPMAAVIGNNPSLPNISGKFLRGPIPWDWLTAAGQLPGRALHVGVAIWHLDGFERSGRVRLKPSTLRDLGVDRFSAYRGLKTLEDYKLISVIRRRGAAPLVTIKR